MRKFHFSQFKDLQSLLTLKGNQRIAVCIPTLNEAETISAIVSTIHAELVLHAPLVDELWVIDSNSSDDTCALAAAAGAQVVQSANVAPHTGAFMGKGENLWKALHLTQADIVCFIDGDITNFHSGFVTGLIGPLLTEPSLNYIKSFYERPFTHADQSISLTGGRVSEILVRPLLSLFYPALCEVIQPLSGEYAARRDVFESLAFPTGYGVEIAHLIDLLAHGGLDHFGQCDLVTRTHRNRDDGELGDMSFAILQVILRRLHRDGLLSLTHPLPSLHHRWLIHDQQVSKVTATIQEYERPPLRS